MVASTVIIREPAIMISLSSLCGLSQVLCTERLVYVCDGEKGHGEGKGVNLRACSPRLESQFLFLTGDL